MSRIPRALWSALVASALACGAVSGGEAKAQAKPPPAPTTHTVKKAPFKIEVKLKGVFEAATMAELMLVPKAWSALQVDKVVEQGTRVKKGDPVLWLDTEKIDEAVRNAEADEALAELGLEQAEEALRALEKTTPLDLAATERNQKRFDEDRKHFFEVELPYSRKSWAFSMKSAEFGLMYATEELRQLEKMYKADDLTEETEEIILKRARHNVERAKLKFEDAKNKIDKALKYDLPRSEENTKDTAERQALADAKARITLPMQLRQKQLEFEKQKRGRDEARKKLAKLKADRKLMTVKAPIDGIVYYGQCDRGHWNVAVAAALRKGGGLKPHQVFITIVQPRPMLVRTDVPEKELHQLKPNLEAVVTPTGYPDPRFGARLTSVSPVPIKEGTFDARLAVNPARADAVLPGMTCSITVIVYHKKDAIAVPAAAVHADGAKRYVLVKTKDGKHARRDVAVGRSASKKVEILKGLKPGETILLRKP